jgi:hypothetical protein
MKKRVFLQSLEHDEENDTRDSEQKAYYLKNFVL